MPLVTLESDSDIGTNIPIDGPDAFMQRMDAEDQSMQHEGMLWCLFDHDVDLFQLIFIVLVLTLDSTK